MLDHCKVSSHESREGAHCRWGQRVKTMPMAPLYGVAPWDQIRREKIYVARKQAYNRMIWCKSAVAKSWSFHALVFFVFFFFICSLWRFPNRIRIGFVELILAWVLLCFHGHCRTNISRWCVHTNKRRSGLDTLKGVKVTLFFFVRTLKITIRSLGQRF